MNNSIKMVKINEKIINLWNKVGRKYSELAPLLYPDMKPNSILFVGMNPSFNRKYIKGYLKKISPSETPEEFFNHKNLDDDSRIKKWIKFEEDAIIDYSTYFKKILKVTSYLNHNLDKKFEFNHIDLFPIRETSQKDTIKRVGKVGKLNGFGEELLAITKSMVQLINPKIIVVVNAKASQHFQSEYLFPYSKEFDEEIGCRHSLVNGRKVQTHFSGMLSGQRALDNGSFARLKWAIKTAYSNRKP